MAALSTEAAEARLAAVRARHQRLLQEQVSRLRYSWLDRYAPYTKQMEFHAAGGWANERLLMAGNQLGKTFCGSAEAAFHATGLYPDWWQGMRFRRPTFGWVGGASWNLVRDNLQRLLLGQWGDFGTGSIPRDKLLTWVRNHHVTELCDYFTVRHVTGGVSRVQFKAYEQGRIKWQSATLDWLWCDEEPPADVWSEGMTRTNHGQEGRFGFMTFTPLMGMSEVVAGFLGDDAPTHRHVTNMTIHDAEHYSPEQRQLIIDSYPEHEREARAQGIPMMGSGLIYPVAQSAIEVQSFPIPDHWPRICGIDFGWDHPAAAVWLAWDRDTDTVYVIDVWRDRHQTAVTHAAAIRRKGDWMPVAWPHDALQHDKGSGDQLKEQYAAEGLNMLPERAQFDDGTNGVEAGLLMILDRMRTGQFKVFSHLAPWFEEQRTYHRQDGKVVKLRDDLMDATRYAVMSLRFAAVPPRGERRTGGPRRRASGWRAA